MELKGRRDTEPSRALVGVSSLALLLCILMTVGCEERSAEPETTAEHTTEDEASPPAAASEPEPPSADTPSDAPSPSDVAGPVEGCTSRGTRDLGAAAWSDVVAHGDGFVAALLTSSEGAESIRLVDVSSTSPRALAESTLDLPAGTRRASGPVLASDGTRLMVAFVDGGARLRVALLSGRRLTPRTVAEGASLRFRPALAVAGDGWAVAWTNAHDTPMRVFSRALRGDGLPSADARDHTPVAGGAAAPTMVAGASPPRLLFLDPRQATSVCLGADWSDNGFADAEVARPVGLVTEPPEVAAVRFGGHDWLAYTGIGNLATTAVGFVALDSTDNPSLLVPGTGYGTLHVDAAPLGAGAVLVADAPLAAPPDSPRTLRLRPVQPDGANRETLTLSGPDEHADRGRVAARSDGRVAVTFRSVEHTWLADVRCAVAADAPDEAPPVEVAPAP